MTIALFVRRLLVLVILAFLFSTGMWGGMNGGNHSPPEGDDPSGEPYHHLPPPWLTSGAAPTCPAAGDSASGGSMGCQGDGIDQVTLWLFVWACACTLASYLGRWLNLARIAFEVLVEFKMRARAGAGAARPRPPAPPVAADDNAPEGAPANLLAQAPGAPPVLADDDAQGAPATLAAQAPGAPPVLADDDAQGVTANLAAQAPGASSVLADNDAEGALANLTAPAQGPPTPPPPPPPLAQGAGNVPGAAAGEAKIDAEVKPSSISASSSFAVPASTPAALPPVCPGRRPLRPMPRRSTSLPDRLFPTSSAVTRISGDFASLARANTTGHHLPFVTAGIIDGGNGRGQ